MAVGMLGVAAGCGGADKAATGQSGAVATTQAATAQGAIVSNSKRIVDAARTGLFSGASYGFVKPGEITQVDGFPSPPPVAHKPGDKGHRVAIVACERARPLRTSCPGAESVFKRPGWDVGVTTAVFNDGVSLRVCTIGTPT